MLTVLDKCVSGCVEPALRVCTGFSLMILAMRHEERVRVEFPYYLSLKSTPLGGVVCPIAFTSVGAASIELEHAGLFFITTGF